MSADSLPYLVLIEGKRPGQLWGRYPTEGDAACAAKKLRALGMAARVVASGETVPANVSDRPRKAP